MCLTHILGNEPRRLAVARRQAFNTVLGLSSIDMVEWLCGQLSVRDVFEGEECLSNPVILSLIHQLAWALNNEARPRCAPGPPARMADQLLCPGLHSVLSCVKYTRLGCW